MSSPGLRYTAAPLARPAGGPSRRLITVTLISVVLLLSALVSVPVYAAGSPTFTNPGNQYSGVNLAASLTVTEVGRPPAFGGTRKDTAIPEEPCAR
jgi:hypothetical protein